MTAALLLSLASTAQVKMRDVLRTMPESLVPYLTENNRLDMIDFHEANMQAEVKNLLEGKSELLSLSDAFAAFALNEAHRMEIRLLDVTEPIDSCQQILCVVDTYGTDVRESTVCFFSLSWQELPTNKFVKLPKAMFTAALDEQQPTLTITLSDYPERPAMEEQKVAQNLPINLKWSNDFFK